MSTLIALLDKHSHLTPDQIVDRIKPATFFKCSELTQDQYQFLLEAPEGIAFYNVRQQSWEGMRATPNRNVDAGRRLRSVWSTYERWQNGYWTEDWYVLPLHQYREGMICPS